MSREWLFYIDGMIAFSEKVLSYTEKLDQTEFELNFLALEVLQFVTFLETNKPPLENITQENDIRIAA